MCVCVYNASVDGITYKQSQGEVLYYVRNWALAWLHLLFDTKWPVVSLMIRNCYLSLMNAWWKVVEGVPGTGGNRTCANTVGLTAGFSADCLCTSTIFSRVSAHGWLEFTA